MLRGQGAGVMAQERGAGEAKWRLGIGRKILQLAAMGCIGAGLGCAADAGQLDADDPPKKNTKVQELNACDIPLGASKGTQSVREWLQPLVQSCEGPYAEFEKALGSARIEQEGTHWVRNLLIADQAEGAETFTFFPGRAYEVPGPDSPLTISGNCTLTLISEADHAQLTSNDALAQGFPKAALRNVVRELLASVAFRRKLLSRSPKAPVGPARQDMIIAALEGAVSWDSAACLRRINGRQSSELEEERDLYLHEAVELGGQEMVDALRFETPSPY